MRDFVRGSFFGDSDRFVPHLVVADFWRNSLLAWGGAVDARASYYMSPDDDYVVSDAIFVSSRVWLHVPPLHTTIQREFPFLQLTYHSVSGYGIADTEDLISAEAINLSVPSDEAFSVYKDLSTSTVAENGVTHITRTALSQIRILPVEGMAGVVGDMVKSKFPGSMVGHFVTPKKNDSIAQPHVELKADRIDAASFSQYLEWEGGVAGGSPERRKVSRESAGQTELKIKMKTTGTVIARMFVWVVWADVTPTPGTPKFELKTDSTGARYKIVNGPGTVWRFVFNIKPAAMFDGSVIERPDLTGESNHPTPGATKPFSTEPWLSADDAKHKWDVSRQMKVTIQNPNSVNLLGASPSVWYATPIPLGQSSVVSVPFPELDVEGNDDCPAVDEEDNPYVPFTNGELDHAVGEVTSRDAPLLAVENSMGASGAYFGTELDFREFARLELWDGRRKSGKFWFRISEQQKWHHHFHAVFNGTSKQWEDSNSTSGIDN